ncbi:MAG: aldehyde ferredoxin oxidoreductase family protein [Desulfobacterales bacterium]|nr:aldehyde ferredoxin oxidoreductase family protein [Desulfobacterales bacterium]
MKGYFFKLLKIDVTSQTFHVEDIDNKIMEASIGGKGLGTQLLLDNNPPGVDPLGPDNHLIITSGPLSGSSLYGSSRYGIFAKSPLTHGYGESYSGGSFAGPLSKTGFDAVIIKGAATSPIWIEINPDTVFFHNAKNVWGKDTFETEDYLKKESKGKHPGIMVIGPAGENLIRFAVIKNDRHRVAGRTGMGAVLGSKKIKGLVCYGDKKPVFHDPDGIKKYKKEMLGRLKNNKVVQAYRNMGTPMMVDLLNNAGAFPTEYWKRGRFEKKDGINAAAMAERLNSKPHACRDCFLGCGKNGEVRQGRHKGLKLEGPEYETIYAFGGLCLIDEIEEIAYLNRLCDSLGVDTISSGNIAAFAIEASKQGKINEKLEYGSADDVSSLIKKIVKRRGVGGILAEGIKPAAEELSMQDDVVHVKGMEPAGYDPRILKGMGLAYAVSERGACHLRTTFYKAELTGMIDPEAIDDKVELFIDFEDRCTLFDSFILCRFFRDLYPWEELSKLLFLTTGLSLDQAELSLIAAKIKDNTRRFNLREGLTAKDDTLPPRFFEHKLEDGKGITQDELGTLVSDYYKIRGWDAKGIPKNM